MDSIPYKLLGYKLTGRQKDRNAWKENDGSIWILELKQTNLPNLWSYCKYKISRAKYFTSLDKSGKKNQFTELTQIFDTVQRLTKTQMCTYTLPYFAVRTLDLKTLPSVMTQWRPDIKLKRELYEHFLHKLIYSQNTDYIMTLLFTDTSRRLIFVHYFV